MEDPKSDVGEKGVLGWYGPARLSVRALWLFSLYLCSTTRCHMFGACNATRAAGAMSNRMAKKNAFAS
jgi:hypothetical protein